MWQPGRGRGPVEQKWNNDRAQALHEVANGGGPWPVVFRQYASFNAYDANMVSVPWLITVSKKPISAHTDIG